MLIKKKFSKEDHGAVKLLYLSLHEFFAGLGPSEIVKVIRSVLPVNVTVDDIKRWIKLGETKFDVPPRKAKLDARRVVIESERLQGKHKKRTKKYVEKLTKEELKGLTIMRAKAGVENHRKTLWDKDKKAFLKLQTAHISKACSKCKEAHTQAVQIKIIEGGKFTCLKCF